MRGRVLSERRVESFRYPRCIFQAVPHAPSRGLSTVAAAGKGFGPVKPPPSPKGPGKALIDGDGDQEKAIREAMRAARVPDASRPVDPQEAARGRIDYVQVENWGSGEPAKLGDLRVERRDTRNAGDLERPFYEQLAMQMQQAESNGLTALAGPAPPPPAKWSWREARYLQYLADQLEVHSALEAALDLVAAAPLAGASASTATAATAATATTGLDASSAAGTSTTASSSSNASTQEDTAGRGPGGLGAALRLLAGAQDLRRAACVRSDLRALQATGAGAADVGTPAADLSAQQRRAAAAAAEAAATLAPGQSARAHAELILRFARVFAGGGEGGEDLASAHVAGAALLAHVSVLYSLHLASGMKVGAAAAPRLKLAQRGALSVYMSYGKEDPLVSLRVAVNAAGAALEPAARDQVFDELPRALQRAGQLLSALAHVD